MGYTGPAVPVDPIPPPREQRGHAAAPRRCPFTCGTCGQPEQPRKGAAQERVSIPRGEGDVAPFLRRRNPVWGRGDVLPSHSRLKWAERAAAPLAEGLTCRLRPPGPGRRRPGRRGRRGRGRGGGGAQPLRCSAGKMAAGREGGSAGGRGGPEATPPPTLPPPR